MSTFKGQATYVGPIQSGTSKSGKQWRKIDVCLTYDNSKPDWPKAIKFSVLNDNIEKFGFVQGGEYEVGVDFSVREYQGKFYMDASCWKATALNAAPAPQPAYPTNPYAAAGMQPRQEQAAPPQDDGGLPF